MELYSASYNVNVGEDNPYIKGIACIIASVALALPLLFLACISFGFFEMSAKAVIETISIYSGVLTVAIVVSLSMPTYLTAARAQKLTGEVVSFDSRYVYDRKGPRHTWYVVEYEYNGHTLQKSMKSIGSYGTEEGTEIPLLVYRKNPAKAITEKQRKNFIVITVIAAALILAGLFLLPISIALLIWSVPILIRAGQSDKIKGRLVEVSTRKKVYSSVVKYECERRSYEAKLPSWSSVRPTIGAPISLRVDPKKPKKPISVGQVIFIIFATIIFTGAGILFGAIGFLVDTDNSEEFTKPFAGSEGVNWALIGWIAFIVFWFLLGIIIIVRTKKRLAKKDLRKTGKRQVCTIEEVDVNTSVVVNGMYPVKIVCSGGGRTFNLKAKVLSTIMRIDESNCPYKVGGKIDIYIDPENEKNYEADFDKLLAEVEEEEAFDNVSVERAEKILEDFRRLLDEANR